ncbi:UPF0602 protein C4orf47 homolog [Chrysoperla carnea]|uniref:UPF0602 protein C4orf47 homolog n=1 Tax=Chrysoperla carnea TaxID=189513 RepID=UPI001D0715A8|nr:UPF0602 protein C4orf47 homolog [Chrysoperla carnea]
MAKFREYAKEDPGMFSDGHAIERVGYFTYPPGLSPLEKRVPKADKNKPENSRFRGTQFITSGLKTKDGTCDAYFEKSFHRIFEKEAISKPPKKSQKKKQPFIPIVPTGPSKLHSTPGDGFGCFSTYSYFSFVRSKKQYKKKSKVAAATFNVGYPGYINPYPPAIDPRLKTKLLKEQKKKKKPLVYLTLNHKTADYFNPNPYFTETPKATYKPPKEEKAKQAAIPWMPVGEPKEIGGGKFGTFDVYPDYFSPRLKKVKKQKKGQTTYGPQVWAETISTFTPSVSQKVIDMQCNQVTYRDYKPTHVSRYLPDL